MQGEVDPRYVATARAEAARIGIAAFVVRDLSELCAPDAGIVWTLRDRRKAERFVGALARHGFAPEPRELARRAHWVGAARMTCAPAPLQAGVRWFTFIPLRQTRTNKARVKLGRWRRQLLRRPVDS